MGPSYVYTSDPYIAIWVHLMYLRPIYGYMGPSYVPQTHMAIWVHLMYSPQIIGRRFGERTQTTPMYIRQTHIRAILYHGPILC